MPTLRPRLQCACSALHTVPPPQLRRRPRSPDFRASFATHCTFNQLLQAAKRLGMEPIKRKYGNTHSRSQTSRIKQREYINNGWIVGLRVKEYGVTTDHLCTVCTVCLTVMKFKFESDFWRNKIIMIVRSFVRQRCSATLLLLLLL